MTTSAVVNMCVQTRALCWGVSRGGIAESAFTHVSLYICVRIYSSCCVCTYLKWSSKFSSVESEWIPFGDLVCGKNRYDICWTFSAMLQLVSE